MAKKVRDVKRGDTMYFARRKETGGAEILALKVKEIRDGKDDTNPFAYKPEQKNIDFEDTPFPLGAHLPADGEGDFGLYTTYEGAQVYAQHMCMWEQQFHQ